MLHGAELTCPELASLINMLIFFMSGSFYIPEFVSVNVIYTFFSAKKD
jgi:hypothetical protein